MKDELDGKIMVKINNKSLQLLNRWNQSKQKSKRNKKMCHEKKT